jgi:hypothetical protein
MPTYYRCDKSVYAMAASLLAEFDTHKSLVDAKVKIDFVFARADLNDNGEPIGEAIMHHGSKALGVARKIGLKDRAMGRGDAEITLDGDWWIEAEEENQRALLDHELHHLTCRMTAGGLPAKTDDLGRPMLSMRKHDVEFGWFKLIAERHGKHSIEQKQAAQLLNIGGQYFFPQLWKQLEAVNG